MEEVRGVVETLREVNGESNAAFAFLGEGSSSRRSDSAARAPDLLLPSRFNQM